MEIDKSIREKYSSEVEELYHKKVRNVYFLVRGINNKDYYIFEGNYKHTICVLEISDNSYRFI